MSTTSPDELTIPFSPIEFVGTTWSQIHLREPTVREVKRLRSAGATEGAIGLMFDVSGVPIGVIEQLPLSVLRKARGFLNGMLRDHATPDPLPESLAIPLRTAITHEDGTLFELELREPTIGQFKRTDGRVGLDIAIALISAITGAPEAVIERVGIRDFKQAEAYLLPFL